MKYYNSKNTIYNKGKTKSLKINDNKLKKKHLKNKEKIERSPKVKNISRKERLIKITQEDVSKYDNNSYRLKKKKPCELKINERHKYMLIKYVKTTEKVKVNQKALKPPLKRKPNRIYKKECVVCMEKKKVISENIIKCGNTENILCVDCRKKMKNNNCPLCRSHKIEGVPTVNNYDSIFINFLSYYNDLINDRTITRIGMRNGVVVWNGNPIN
jgi:hypothetical protein